MKLFRKIVDERQELDALRVERVALYFVIFGLLAATFVQILFFGADFPRIAGELIIMMAGCLFAGIGYICRGFYDYYTKPGMKSYILYSLAFGIVVGAFDFLVRYFRRCKPLSDCLGEAVKIFAITFIVCFIMYILVGAVTKARQRKLTKEYQDEDGL